MIKQQQRPKVSRLMGLLAGRRSQTYPNLPKSNIHSSILNKHSKKQTTRTGWGLFFAFLPAWPEHLPKPAQTYLKPTQTFPNGTFCVFLLFAGLVRWSVCCPSLSVRWRLRVFEDLCEGFRCLFKGFSWAAQSNLPKRTCGSACTFGWAWTLTKKNTKCSTRKGLGGFEVGLGGFGQVFGPGR